MSQLFETKGTIAGCCGGGSAPQIQMLDMLVAARGSNLVNCSSVRLFLLQRESIIHEKAQQQYAAALDTYSPLHQSPLSARDTSTTGSSEPVRGVGCMMGSSSSYGKAAGRHTCMPKGLDSAAHSCMHAPGGRAAYVM